MIDEILLHWKRRAVTLRYDILLSGSPERCAMRAVVEDKDGDLLVLERLIPGQARRREVIARILARLAGNGLARCPGYIPSAGNGYVMGHRGDHYMLARLIPGDPPPRPDAVAHGWRGHALAEFLLALERTASAVSPDLFAQLGPPLDLPSYAAALAETLRKRRAEAHDRLVLSMDRLAPFFKKWNALPKRLCHGDYHPLNVLWSDDGITGVIDWEFMGLKPALYDAANCVGCAGSEGPEALTAGLAAELIDSLKGAGWDLTLLPETVAALRVGWLSEWLRRDDRDMIDLELDYLTLLTKNLDRLRSAWRVA
ncbi:MAG: phosphotransferase enzyme family protein [Oceanidesulfovibrio sp.]